jgi:hypothetical protein
VSVTIEARLLLGLAPRGVLDLLSLVDEAAGSAQPQGAFLRSMRTMPPPFSMMMSTVATGPGGRMESFRDCGRGAPIIGRRLAPARRGVR